MSKAKQKIKEIKKVKPSKVYSKIKYYLDGHSMASLYNDITATLPDNFGDDDRDKRDRIRIVIDYKIETIHQGAKIGSKLRCKITLHQGILSSDILDISNRNVWHTNDVLKESGLT